MPDKGIQIVVALLEKRESYRITKDSNPTLVKELLRARELGYVEKESKSSKYTLSEKGRKWVYSGYCPDSLEPHNQISAVMVPEAAVWRFQLRDLLENGRLPVIHASGLFLPILFLLLGLIKWLLT
jgi:hypothetical protein